MPLPDGPPAPRSIFELIYEDFQRLRAARLRALAAMWEPPDEPASERFNPDGA